MADTQRANQQIPATLKVENIPATLKEENMLDETNQQLAEINSSQGFEYIDSSKKQESNQQNLDYQRLYYE